jgi:hypothetical protein
MHFGRRDLTHSVVSYDHPHHALLEEAITIDFMDSTLGPGARVAVEMMLESAEELSWALAGAIAAAEITRGLQSAMGLARSWARADTSDPA